MKITSGKIKLTEVMLPKWRKWNKRPSNTPPHAQVVKHYKYKYEFPKIRFR